jgi:hypothetical protein
MSFWKKPADSRVSLSGYHSKLRSRLLDSIGFRSGLPRVRVWLDWLMAV